MSERRPSRWEQQVAANPDHSRWYTDRFRAMAAAGRDLAGEARLIDAMATRGSRVLDAGCGPGRVAGELHARGLDVVGVDIDPYLIEAAKVDHPGPSYVVGDLSYLDPAAPELAAGFDLIVCAGNVMTFLAPGTEGMALAGFRSVLRPGGRAVIGFGAGRGYAFDDLFADAARASLALDLALATWDLRPFTPTSDFLVAVFSRTD